MALISALEKAHELGATELECMLDSKLVVEQLSLRWKVKHPAIKPLFIDAWNLMQLFSSVKLKHILREKNKEADQQVNNVLDKVLG